MSHLRSFNTRTQLERLHDRHKRFSLNVYDYHTSNNEEKLVEAKENLKKTEKELDELKKQIYL